MRCAGTRKSMAANMILACSTSSRSATSTWARWRTRASTSSIRAISSPTPRLPPTPISTVSRAWSRTNISTTGPATGSPAATGSSSVSRKVSPSTATRAFPPTWARRRSSGSRMYGSCALRNFPRMPVRWPIRSARKAIRKSPISTPPPSTTRAPRSSG